MSERYTVTSDDDGYEQGIAWDGQPVPMKHVAARLNTLTRDNRMLVELLEAAEAENDRLTRELAEARGLLETARDTTDRGAVYRELDDYLARVSASKEPTDDR